MEPSLFYQIAGKRIDAHGMFVEQNNSLNFNVSSSYKFLGMTGIDFRFEGYYGGAAYNYRSEKKNRWLRSAKSYFSLRLGGDSYYEYDYFSILMCFGFGKDFHPTRNSFISPYIGYGIEMTDPTNYKPNNWDADQLDITTDIINSGIDIGYNLLHNIQLFVNGEYNLIIYSRITTSKDNDDSSFSNPFKYWNSLGELDRGETYNDVFPNRGGLTAGGGIRIMF
jgi:hypothetical protein